MEKNNRNEVPLEARGQSGKEGDISVTGDGHTSNFAYVNKRILVPLDGSPLAEMALPHAIEMARATRSGLLLMRIVPPFNPPIPRIMPMGPMYYEGTEVEALYDEQQTVARDYLEGLVERLVSMKLQVGALTTDGIPEDVIVQYAQKHPDILMIAMSTHGRSGVKRWLFGSVAEKVLHSSPIPVLLVRPGSEIEEFEEREIQDSAAFPLYKTILVPLDGSHVAEQALEHVQPLAQALDARVVLLSVVSTPFDLKLVKRGATADWSAMPRTTQTALTVEYLDGISEKLATAGVTAQAQVTHGDRVEEILSAAIFERAGLIVMAMQGHGDWKHPKVGSVAMSVAQRAQVPLLLVRVDEQEHKQQGIEGSVQSAIYAQESTSIGVR